MIALTLYDGRDTPIMVRGTHREAALQCEKIIRVFKDDNPARHQTRPRRCAATGACGDDDRCDHDRHKLATTFGAGLSRWCRSQEARSQPGLRTDRQRPGLPHQGWEGFVRHHRSREAGGVTQCWRSVAAVAPRPKLPLRTRSRTCAVSISKVFVQDGRAYFGARRPITCHGICCSQSLPIEFKPISLATWIKRP